MRRWLAGLLGTFGLANGLFMLVAPSVWAGVVPGVAAHGPIPPHFLQDVGAAYVAAALGLLARAVRPAWWPAAAAGTTFLVLHAVLHLIELVSGHAHAPLSELGLVVLPAGLAIVASLPATGPGLSTAVARWGIARFERQYDYDSDYMRFLLDTSPAAFWKFTTILGAANHRESVPAEAHFAAKLVGAVSEDCGPCSQLAVTFAREARVPDDQLAAVLERRVADMSEDTAVGFRFADAVVRRTGDEDDAREAVRARWGDPGILDLSLAIAVGRVFPMTKVGLGYARECRLVKVADRVVSVKQA